MLLPPMRAPMISCCLVQVCVHSKLCEIIFFRETKSVCCVSARVASYVGRGRRGGRKVVAEVRFWGSGWNHEQRCSDLFKTSTQVDHNRKTKFW